MPSVRFSGAVPLFFQYAFSKCMGKTLSFNSPHYLCPDSNKSNYGGFWGGGKLNILKILNQVCVASSEISIHTDWGVPCHFQVCSKLYLEYILSSLHTETAWSTLKNFASVCLFNPLNAELNPICHLLALVGAHHILHVSRVRVKIINSGKWTLKLSLYKTCCTVYMLSLRQYL